MKHVYVSRKGDLERVKENLENFRAKTDKELIDSYNDSVVCCSNWKGSYMNQ